MASNLSICSNPAYQNSLLIKRRFQINHVPPPRYDNLSNNPYNNYTQSQLDMRRKAEVLQYNAIKSSTKTNNFTKRQRWAQLVSGSTQKRSLSSAFIQENTVSQTDTSIFIQTCPSGTIIQTPSYASDVPGPIVSLFFDPAIPLYNYSTGQDPYALINTETLGEPFTYTSPINQPLYYINTIPQNSILLTSITIRNIKTMTYSFIIKIPVSMYIRGEVKSTIINNKSSFKKSLALSINNNNNKLTPFSCNVNYLNTKLNVLYEFSGAFENNVTFDVSMIPNYTDPINNYFYGNQYIGNVTISNFRVIYDNTSIIQNGLDVQNGYVYDICLNVLDGLNYLSAYFNSYNYNSSDFNKYFNNVTTGYYINVTPDKMNKFTNCKIREPDSVYSGIAHNPLTVT